MDACSLRKYFKKMSSDIDMRVFPWKPFPSANIFDPLCQFNPIETYITVNGSATENAYQQIDLFFNRVSSLLRQVNSLSWLHVFWEKKIIPPELCLWKISQ